MTGDLVWGEYDDGTTFRKLVKKMDSYKIPWAPIFGNHEQASQDTTITQLSQIMMESEYCVFYKRHEIGGIGNYSIALSVNGELQRMIYMLDNCYLREADELEEGNPYIRTYTYRLSDRQLAWYKTSAVKASEVANEQIDGTEKIPSFLCMHVPTADFYAAAEQANVYEGITNLMDVNYDSDFNGSVYQTNGLNDTSSTFGFLSGGNAATYSRFIYKHLQVANTDGVFVGHQHSMALSAMYQGIRFTFGLKTGRYAGYYNAGGQEKTGGTLITLQGKQFGVKHVQPPKWGGIF